MNKKRKEKLILGEKCRCPKCLCRKTTFILLLRLEKLTKGSLITFLSNRCHGNGYKSNSLIILTLAVRCISSESLNWNGQINWKMCFILYVLWFKGKNFSRPTPPQKHPIFSLMLRFCARKQIRYNSEHPKLYNDTKETMSCGGCYENVFLGTFRKMAHGLRVKPKPMVTCSHAFQFPHVLLWNSKLFLLRVLVCLLCVSLCLVRFLT